MLGSIIVVAAQDLSMNVWVQLLYRSAVHGLPESGMGTADHAPHWMSTCTALGMLLLLLRVLGPHTFPGKLLLLGHPSPHLDYGRQLPLQGQASGSTGEDDLQ